MKPLTFFITVLFAAKFGYAQNISDSLQKIIDISSDNVKKVAAYKDLTGIYSTKDFYKAIELSDKGILFADKIKNDTLKAVLLRNKGVAQYLEGDYDEAAKSYYAAVAILEKTGDKINLGRTLNNIGQLFRKKKDFKRALENYDRALMIFRETGSKEDEGTILNESGVVYEYMEDYDEAINRYSASLNIRKETKDLLGEAYSLNFIGGVKLLQKKYEEAGQFNLQAIAIRKQLRDSFGLATNYSDLASVYLAEKNYPLARAYYDTSNRMADALHYPELKSINLSQLSELESALGNYNKAYELYKQYVNIKDSLYTLQSNQQIAELATRYETEKKEQQIRLQHETLRKKQLQIWGLVIVILLAAIIAYLSYHRYRLRQEARLQAEVIKQQDLATKAVLEAEEKERQRIARDLHDGIGQTMSAARMNLSAIEHNLPFRNEQDKTNFEKAMALVDESCKEVRAVSHNMMPNTLLKSGLAGALREFIDKIDSHIIRINLETEGLQERLGSDTEIVLYRVIQECVNNVIKHSGANQLDISIIRDQDGISATIEDNGKGFDTNDKEKFSGIGLKNILTRVQFLKGTVDFDSAPGRGTLVAIHIPGTSSAG